MKILVTMGCVLALCSCKEQKVADADPQEGVRAISAVYEAAKAERLAEFESRKEGASASEAASLSTASRRLDEAKQAAKAAGFSADEITLRVLKGSGDATDQISKALTSEP